MLDRAREATASAPAVEADFVRWTDVEEEILPVDVGAFDVLLQCRYALKPDGLFLGAMLGGTTLQELRIACTIAQQEREGGVAPRVSPLAQVRDAGNLLTRAGFAIPAVDVDDIQVQYRDPVDLVRHLRHVGETGALQQGRAFLPRDTALATAAVYASLFGGDAPEEGVIYLTGWAPDPKQPRAAKRGSATVSFEDIHREFSPSQ
ncbi:hypothetical protein QBZ16_005111 [Prototheca wickerhamii]|uniref:SAM-dependent methyltransferase n=1 Tax=Prototheca wickerhamii TaxID=3111 RepID=A0AAD9IET8_PROWI|nr:hypothetical protein QBZ16_005111 [Prototheca wickerhamii]